MTWWSSDKSPRSRPGLLSDRCRIGKAWPEIKSRNLITNKAQASDFESTLMLVSANKKPPPRIESLLGYLEVSFALTILCHEGWAINLCVQTSVFWSQDLAAQRASLLCGLATAVFLSFRCPSYLTFRHSRSAWNVRADCARIVSATLALMTDVGRDDWLGEPLIHQWFLNHFQSSQPLLSSPAPHGVLILPSFHPSFLLEISILSERNEGCGG